jgi:hypothetical protein
VETRSHPLSGVSSGERDSLDVKRGFRFNLAFPATTSSKNLLGLGNPTKVTAHPKNVFK